MKSLLRRLERQRDRLFLDLQIIEMAHGYDYMMALPQNQTHRVLEAECERLRSEIAKAEAQK